MTRGRNPFHHLNFFLFFLFFLSFILALDTYILHIYHTYITDHPSSRKIFPFFSFLVVAAAAVRSSSGSCFSSPFGMYSFTEDEMYVAEIMRNLHKLFRKFRRRVPCCKAVWRTKKKRSSVNRKPNHIYSRLLSFSSSSPPQQPTPMEPEPELETMASAGLCTKPNTKASSPSTPLCFYPSAGENTDDKSGVASASPRRSKRIKIQNKEVMPPCPK